MKEPYGGTVTDISSAERILGDKMATMLTAIESSDLVSQVGKSYTHRFEEQSLFHCEVTGIKFEAESTTVVTYSLEYGDEYTNLIQENGYELLGPIFNVQVISGRVSAVHLPHYVCLEGLRGDKSMIKFGDFKDGKIILKTPTSTEDSYVILKDPPFSCVAVIGEYSTSIWRKKRPYPFKGKVLLYFRVVCADDEDDMEYRIHLYLVPSDKRHVKEIDSMKIPEFKRIDKPSLIDNVFIKTNYIIIGKPNPTIMPETLQFTVHKETEDFHFTELNFTNDAKEISLSVALSPESKPLWKGELTKADVKELSRQATQRGVSPEHFIDNHRAKLIERVNNIMPVLDVLKEKNLLTEEIYRRTTCQSTPQEKMRELLNYVQKWGCEDKKTVYEVVKVHNKPCIEQIEKEK